MVSLDGWEMENGKEMEVRKGCKLDPFDCDKSLFCEIRIEGTEDFKRWIECVDIDHFKKGKRLLVIESNAMLCCNAPDDWWLDYQKRVEKNKGRDEIVS